MPVEFLGDDDDAPPTAPAASSGRRSLVLRVLAVAVAAIAGLAWVLTRPDGGGVSGAPRATVTVRPSPIPSPTYPTALQTISCRTGAPVTTDVASAMRHFLPALKVANLNAYRCVRGHGPGSRIVFEAVTGRFRGMNIDVEATRRGFGKPMPSPHLGAEGGKYVELARIETVAAGLRVAVVDYARPGRHRVPPGDAMLRLADFVSLNVVL